jgi:hypothetical protein
MNHVYVTSFQPPPAGIFIAASGRFFKPGRWRNGFLLTLVALLIGAADGRTETITRSSTNGLAGQNGTGGGSSQSIAETAEDPADAVKVLDLTAGFGGAGGFGVGVQPGDGGSGGGGGDGGRVSGIARVTADFPLQSANLTLRGGTGGGGGGGAAGQTSHGSGGSGGKGGNASGKAFFTAGPGTTEQRASVRVTAGGSGRGGDGAVGDPSHQNGFAGFSGRPGEAEGLVFMRGSSNTTLQSVTFTVNGTSSGGNGFGAGTPFETNSVFPSVGNAKGSLDLETPADNASITANISLEGASGTGRPLAVQGGPRPGTARLEYTRIAIPGTNASVTVSVGVTGGSANSWSNPDLGPGFVVPGGTSGGRGAEAIVDGLDIIAGSGGRISGSFSVLSGNGGGVFAGPSSSARGGTGGKVTLGPDVFRAVSEGGPLTLNLQAFGGTRGLHAGGGVNGAGGSVNLINALAATNTVGSITLIQTARGGLGGGRAVSLLDRRSTSTGDFYVEATAGGGVRDRVGPLEEEFSNPAGTARASAGATGEGRSTHAVANSDGRGTIFQPENSLATAVAVGPTNVIAESTARADQRNGRAAAVAQAVVTVPGSPAAALAQFSGFGPDVAQTATASATARGGNLPAREVSSTWRVGNAAAISSSLFGGRARATASPTALGFLGAPGVPNGVETVALDPASPGQVFAFLTTPLAANPVVSAFFNDLVDERHLVRTRIAQRLTDATGAPTAGFDGNRILRSAWGGSFRLAEGESGESLVLAGLGFTAQAGGFDTLAFSFHRNGTALLTETFTNAAEAAAFFANRTSVLADLTQSGSDTLFSWAIETTASSAQQSFEIELLFSATASSGLLPGGGPESPAPAVRNFAVRRAVDDLDPEADFVPVLISGEVTQAAPDTLYFVEATPDLNRQGPWDVVGTLTTDSRGVASFPALALASPLPPQGLFFRLRQL